MRKLRRAFVVTMLAVALGLTAGLAGVANHVHVASAKITEVCRNPGGQEPQGNCQGEALTKRNENPAGKAPPGQNK